MKGVCNVLKNLVIMCVLTILTGIGFYFSFEMKKSEVLGYVGLIRATIEKEKGQPFEKEEDKILGNVIGYKYSETNYEVFRFPPKTELYTTHLQFFPREMFEEKLKELKRLYGEPKLDSDGDYIFNEQIKLFKPSNLEKTEKISKKKLVFDGRTTKDSFQITWVNKEEWNNLKNKGLWE